MRRANSGYSYEPLSNTISNSLEEENDQITDELKDKIHALKSLSIDIGTEVKYQDKMLYDMDEDFERTRGLLSGSVARIIQLRKGNHSYYIIYLFLFSIGIFFLLWIFLKFK